MHHEDHWNALQTSKSQNARAEKGTHESPTLSPPNLLLISGVKIHLVASSHQKEAHKHPTTSIPNPNRAPPIHQVARAKEIRDPARAMQA